MCHTKFLPCKYAYSVHHEAVSSDWKQRKAVPDFCLSCQFQSHPEGVNFLLCCFRYCIQQLHSLQHHCKQSVNVSARSFSARGGGNGSRGDKPRRSDFSLVWMALSRFGQGCLTGSDVISEINSCLHAYLGSTLSSLKMWWNKKKNICLPSFVLFVHIFFFPLRIVSCLLCYVILHKLIYNIASLSKL